MGTVREEVAKNLLFYRKKAGLTQRELAEKLGVKNTAVSNWESGNNSVDIETLFKASKIFGVSLADMYGQYSTLDPAPAPAPALTWDQEDLLDNYAQLNEEGKEDLRKQARVMVSSGMYRECPVDDMAKNA